MSLVSVSKLNAENPQLLADSPSMCDSSQASKEGFYLHFLASHGSGRSVSKGGEVSRSPFEVSCPGLFHGPHFWQGFERHSEHFGLNIGALGVTLWLHF